MQQLHGLICGKAACCEKFFLAGIKDLSGAKAKKTIKIFAARSVWRVVGQYVTALVYRHVLHFVAEIIKKEGW